MPPGDVVRVKNVSKRTFVGGYAQQRYEVKAGKQAVVPREAAQHWTGRWDLLDGRKKDRAAEYERLMVLYGIFSDSSGSEDEKREKNIPQLEVWDLEDNRIDTVLDDPTGEKIHPVASTAHEKGLVDEQIATLRRELSALQSVAAHAQIEGYEPTSDVAEPDTPTRVPVSDGPRRGRTAQGS